MDLFAARALRVLLVSAYPESLSNYTAQLYAGLYELQAGGIVQLRFGIDHEPIRDPADIGHATLFMELTDTERVTRRPLRIAFDLEDTKGIKSRELLDFADVYFKRSYRTSVIEAMAPADRSKIMPFGLHYACTSPNEGLSDRMQHAFGYNRIHGRFRSRPLRAIGSVVRQIGMLAMTRSGLKSRLNELPALIPEFELPPEAGTKRQICYRTRVYDQTHSRKENDMRVATIRALKQNFGDGFVGGLRSSAYARRHYPDCIFPQELDWRGHLALVKSSMICVSTSGLHDSSDWKIPEYLAASRCVVTEHVKYDLPSPLIDGVHLLGFSSPDECVAACERILEDARLANALRRNGFDYYRAHVQPEQTMRRCLDTALKFQHVVS